MNNDSVVYTIATTHRVAIQWLDSIDYRGIFTFVRSTDTLRDADQGLIYALAPDAYQRKDWPELLDVLVAREARHL